ncbi:unnamed protein product, partial [Penicillium salamii]
MVPKDLLHEGVMESIISLPGFSARYFPFCAQHQILQFIQRQPETHAFCFLQCWLPSESLAAGWTCPEALELHKFFRLLEVHQGKVKGECFQLTWSTLTGWRRVISSIRHAAVHRIPHDRKHSLRWFAPPSNFRNASLASKAPKDFVAFKTHRDHLARRLVLLPEAVRRVLQSIEDGFV